MRKIILVVLAAFMLMVTSALTATATVESPGMGQGFFYECADYFQDSNYYSIVKWEWNETTNEYELDEQNHMYMVFVTDVTGNATHADWESNYYVEAVLVKGALDAYAYEYDPTTLSGSVSNSNIFTPGGQNNADISHITFCGYHSKGSNGGGNGGNEVPEFGTFALIAAVLGATLGIVMLRKH